MNRYRILITGSSGYLGSVLTRYLIQQGHFVIGADRTPPSDGQDSHGFVFSRIDMTDRDSVERLMTRERPDKVVHLAFILTPMRGSSTEEDNNIQGSENVISCACDAGVEQFVHFSSAAVYGADPDNPLWIDEGHPIRPGHYRYGLQKAKVEEILGKYIGSKGPRVTILRLCTVSGPSCKKKDSTVRQFRKAPFLPKFNNEFCPVQFLHEEDLSAMIGLILSDDGIEGIFNLAPPDHSTSGELIPEKLHVPVPLYPAKKVLDLLWYVGLSPWKGDSFDLCTYGIIIDPSKLIERYDYRFKYTTLSGFRDTIERGSF